MISIRILSVIFVASFAVVVSACSADTTSGNTGAGSDDVTGAGAVCGGIAGLDCHAGQRCEIKSTHPDATGTCVTAKIGEEGATCAGIAGLPCNEGLVCKKSGTAIDASGICSEPLTTPATPIFAKVGESCGTRGSLKCASGLSCIFSEAAKCGAADQPGSCVDERGIVCTEEIAQVCGCDGKTYSNACAAGVKGASVSRKGPC